MEASESEDDSGTFSMVTLEAAGIAESTRGGDGQNEDSSAARCWCGSAAWPCFPPHLVVTQTKPQRDDCARILNEIERQCKRLLDVGRLRTYRKR